MRSATVVRLGLLGVLLLAWGPKTTSAMNITDLDNYRWDVQHDGSIADGNNDTFDGGECLIINGQRFQGAQQQPGSDAREVVIGPQNMGGLLVTRKIRVSERMPGCRFLEIIENQSPQPMQVQISLFSDLGNTVQAANHPSPSKDGRVPYVAIDQGGQGQGDRSCLAYCMASPQSKLLVQIQTRNDQVTLAYESLTLKRGEKMALLHVCAQRSSVADAEEYAKRINWAAFMRELDKSDRALVRNVRTGGGLLSVGGVELFRGEGGDVIRLTSGELLTGSLETPAFSLETEFGIREVPAEQALSLFDAGDDVRLVTKNGEVLTGRLKVPALKLKLRGGKELDVPLDCVAKYGKRLPQAKAARDDENANPEASEQFTFTDPIFILRNGDRLVGKTVTDKLDLNTLFGPVTVGLKELKRIEFPHAELRAPLVELTDGSSFSALPGARQFEVKLSAGPTIKLDAGRLSAVLFTPGESAADEPKEARKENANAPELPIPFGQLRLLNQDLFCGTLSGNNGQLMIETPFGRQTIAADQVMRLKPRRAGLYNVRLTLWDGNVFPARLSESAIGFTTNGGARMEIPVGMIALYWRPLALPPADESARIEGLIAKLGDNEPQAREEAQKALIEIGHGTRALLAKHWNAQDLETRTRVRRLLEKMQENAPKEALDDEDEDADSPTAPQPARTAPPVPFKPMPGGRRMIMR